MTKISNQYSLTNILTADLANSRLGINNVSPTVALDVTGAGRFSSSVTAGGNIAASGTGNITIQAVSSNNFPVFQLVDNRVGGNAWNFEGGRTLGNLALRDSNAGIERMTWTSAGNVGIGTTVPLAKATVRGGNLGNSVNMASTVFSVQGNDQGIFMGSFNGTPNYGSWIQAGREAFDLPFNLILQPNGGNVGIGTTTPATLLHVNGSITVGTGGNLRLSSNSNEGELVAAFGKGMKFYTNDGNSNPLNLTSAGNVGIGTTTPGANLTSSYKVLEINGTYPVLRFGTSSTINFDIVSDSAATGFYSRLNTPMLFTTNDVERMRITSGGNVGIGFSNPTRTLQVAGVIQGNNISQIDATGTGSPQSLGLNINAGSGGRVYLLSISAQWSDALSTSADLYLIRCGYNGNLFTSTFVAGTHNLASFSQVGGILYITLPLNYAFHVQVLNNA